MLATAAGRMPALPGRAARRSAPTMLLCRGLEARAPRHGAAGGRTHVRGQDARAPRAGRPEVGLYHCACRGLEARAPRGDAASRAGCPRSQGGTRGGRPLPLCLPRAGSPRSQGGPASRAGSPRSQGGGRSHHVRGQDARAPRKLSARAHRTNGVLGEHALLKRLAGTARPSRMWQRRTLCELFWLCAIMHAFFSCLLRAFILQLGLSPAMFPF